jgi:hypothetical protein
LSFRLVGFVLKKAEQIQLVGALAAHDLGQLILFRHLCALKKQQTINYKIKLCIDRCTPVNISMPSPSILKMDHCRKMTPQSSALLAKN